MNHLRHFTRLARPLDFRLRQKGIGAPTKEKIIRCYRFSWLFPFQRELPSTFRKVEAAGTLVWVRRRKLSAECLVPRNPQRAPAGACFRKGAPAGACFREGTPAGACFREGAPAGACFRERAHRQGPASEKGCTGRGLLPRRFCLCKGFLQVAERRPALV